MKRIFISILFFVASFVIAQIKHVPTDYEKIQDAIDDSKDGDVIIIEEGIYYQQINFKGKAITVASEFFIDDDTSHISKTIIDGSQIISQDSASLVYINSGEDSTSVLTGLTLQNGKGTYGKWTYENVYGGAIEIYQSGATISYNIIKENKCDLDVEPADWGGAWGGGIDCWELPKHKSIIIHNNIFKNNMIKSHIAQAMGGGILLMDIYGKARISSNKIINNQVESIKSGYGGGICVAGANNKAQIVIDNNYIASNSTYSLLGSTKGGGIACYFSDPIIRNNIIVYNQTKYPTTIASFDAFGGGIAVFWYIDYWQSDFPVCEDPYNLVSVIENNTIAYNNDKKAGGGVAFRSVGARLKNNIIGCNFANEQNNKQIKIEYKEVSEDKARTVYVDYCNVEGDCEELSKFHKAVGNINIFPEFKDEENWYLKKELSPCIDNGDPNEKYKDLANPQYIDQAYFPALGSLRNDIGAFGGPYSKWAEMGKPTNIKNKSTLLMDNFYLSQNFPNPFNPSTIIKYQIPHPSAGGVKSEKANVKLVVYDILGRVVTTLVNEKQKPGSYEIDFDGSELTSGIYLYRLRAGDPASSTGQVFVETKKMILIK